MVSSFFALFAYIGPGAGIALAGSFLVVLTAIFAAFLILLTWPIRWLWRTLKNRKALSRARVKRVVILGLDGLDPELTETLLMEGALPNLARLKEQGCYHRLGTTWPPLSPVAWSSFSTATNPGKHQIFDFITRNPATYLPEISSVKISPPRRQLKLGRFHIPLSRPEIRGLRKSKPFWNVLGEHGIFSNILRVPITFPPDRFRGVQLSAMCVPDLRGTQGMFTWFVEGAGTESERVGNEDGMRSPVVRSGDVVRGELEGPANALRSEQPVTRLPFQVTRREGKDGDVVELRIDGQTIALRPGEYTDWVTLAFPLAPGIKARGICRFLLRQFEAPFQMSTTPIHIDPDKPVMPISHPRVYANYLAKNFGSFATMGLAEDTWSLSENVITESEFLEQAWDIDRERRAMFYDALEKTRRGLVTCVFDGPDRIQHMFWRFQDPHHPNYEKGNPAADSHRTVIRDLYREMDALVGKTLDEVGRDTALFVMSDHGFKPFRRGVDLNAWLRDQGHLVLKGDKSTTNEIYLADIDWSRTRAYAIGLAGIYLNLKGREAQGIVAPGEEAAALVTSICQQLTGLIDSQTGGVAIHEAVPRERVYQGPYVEGASDIIVGYNVGYRVGWDAAVGKCGGDVFSDNMNAWSGDHCIHPDLVPGILFSNIPLAEAPKITDIGPTALELLGISKPGYMDGRSLLCAEEPSQN